MLDFTASNSFIILRYGLDNYNVLLHVVYPLVTRDVAVRAIAASADECQLSVLHINFICTILKLPLTVQFPLL